MSQEGVLLSYYYKINETQAEIIVTSLKHMFINNHEIEANKGKIKGQIALEHIFGFCKTF